MMEYRGGFCRLRNKCGVNGVVALAMFRQREETENPVVGEIGPDTLRERERETETETETEREGLRSLRKKGLVCQSANADSHLSWNQRKKERE